MNTKTLLLSVLCVTSFTAFADDGGIVGIRVDDIQVQNDLGYDAKAGKEILKTAPNPNLQISITGNEANKLLQILPPSEYVEANSNHPAFQKLFNANVRALAINGKNNQPSVTISCDGGDLDYGQVDTPVFKRYADGAHCRIVIQAQSVDENVDYTFDPKQNSCH